MCLTLLACPARGPPSGLQLRKVGRARVEQLRNEASGDQGETTGRAKLHEADARSCSTRCASAQHSSRAKPASAPRWSCGMGYDVASPSIGLASSNFVTRECTLETWESKQQESQGKLAEAARSCLEYAG
eukprot:11947239-Alexandrium_andersonii.AAC.1